MNIAASEKIRQNLTLALEDKYNPKKYKISKYKIIDAKSLVLFYEKLRFVS